MGSRFRINPVKRASLPRYGTFELPEPSRLAVTIRIRREAYLRQNRVRLPLRDIRKRGSQPALHLKSCHVGFVCSGEVAEDTSTTDASNAPRDNQSVAQNETQSEGLNQRAP